MVSLPRIPGHEVAAEIIDMGKSVPAIYKAGMKTTLSPYTSCGSCPSCRHARPNACQFNQTMGVQRDGAMTEYICAPWEKLYCSEKLSFNELAIVEPLTVGFHATARGEVKRGDTVAVLGCGAIGLGAIAASAWKGGETIAVDIDDAKLQTAKKAGAVHLINSSSQNLHEVLEEITGGGPDVVIEAIGLPATFRAAVEEVAFSGRIVYIGYAKEPVAYETKMFVQKELDIRGSRNALGDFSEVMTMLESGVFPSTSVITSTTDIDGAGSALQNWNKNPAAICKILVNMAA
jgi:threonine dehydrogenase-like Zn-dependent dehydrogenase